MSSNPDIWTDNPPEFEIKDGIGRIRVASGGHEINIRCSPHTLLAGSVKAMQAYSKWDAEERPEPVPFKRG